MIAYFDASAFVPLLIDEPGTEACRDLWNEADIVASSQLLYAEAAAVVAGAERGGRIAVDEADRALGRLDEYWPEIRRVDVDDRLVRSAAGHARRFGLRGYDAVHCAAAEILGDGNLVAAAGDRRLLSAWDALGLRVFDPNRLS